MQLSSAQGQERCAKGCPSPNQNLENGNSVRKPAGLKKNLKGRTMSRRSYCAKKNAKMKRKTFGATGRKANGK
jgi:hypothetical protein